MRDKADNITAWQTGDVGQNLQLMAQSALFIRRDPSPAKADESERQS